MGKYWQRFCKWLVREAARLWDDYVRGLVGSIVVACVVLVGFWIVQWFSGKLFPDGGGPYIKYILELRGVAALAAVAAYGLRGLWQIFKGPPRG